MEQCPMKTDEYFNADKRGKQANSKMELKLEEENTVMRFRGIKMNPQIKNVKNKT